MINGTNGHVRSRSRIAVVDYGVNNIGSVINMLRRLEVDAVPARSEGDLDGVSGIVLPGIGAFDAGVTNLRNAGLFDAIKQRVTEQRLPVLGICLGMQLLSQGSEEGKLEGLGLIRAYARRLPSSAGMTRLKVPHMGWNETVCIDRKLFASFEDSAARFYYVHSYHVVCDDEADVAARCLYGIEFTAALRRGHIFGTQFHPEKSHRFGMRVLSNFVSVTGHA